MHAFTARSIKSSGSLPVTPPKQPSFTFLPWLALALAAVCLLFGSSCTKKQLLSFLKPAPTAVTPSSAAAGSPNTPIVVTGTNLDNSPILFFDQTPLVITSATATEIDSMVPADDLATPGSHALTVVANLPGGPLRSTPVPFVVTSAMAAPVLAITKSHTGSFMQGSTGAYTITVSNTGSGATDGSQITVTDMLPTGLTLISLDGGSTWICNTTMATCTRSDALNGGSAYPLITLDVAVATNAPATVTNMASVSGGGSSPATSMDPTTINPAGGGTANLTLSIMHSPMTFSRSGTGIHTLTVGNTGTLATSGTVSVNTTHDPDETVVSVDGGSFFNCSIVSGDASCTSIGNLAAGATAQIKVNVTLGPTFTGTIDFQAVANALGTSGASASDMVQVQ